MRIKVLFDKNALDKNLHTGWGVSFLVDTRVLFDTGEKGPWLIKNMRYLGVDINKIEAVVISHDHWDHTGGLWDVLKEKRGLKVYACPDFSRGFKEKAKGMQADLIEVDKFTQVSEGIFITGQIPGTYHNEYIPEQAMVLKTENGLTVITGCSHPGILKILEKVKARFPQDIIYLVAGGFHLMESDRRFIEIVVEGFKKMKVLKAAPTHCSGPEAESMFKKEYGEKFISILVGEDIKV